MNKIQIEKFKKDLDKSHVKQYVDNFKKYITSDNILRIFCIDNYEIRHSNILAWLLNPKESHKLGLGLLNKIYYNIYKIKLDCNDIIVTRETENNIDIFIKIPSNNEIIIFENKIHSCEGKNQLKNYRMIVEKKYPEYKKTLIYLTKNGDKGTDENNWYTLTWDVVSKYINELLNEHKNTITPKIQYLLKDYCNTLNYLSKENNMTKEIKEECTKLYKEYNEVIDFIIKNREQTAMFPLCLKYLKERKDIICFSNENNNHRNRIRFIPKSLQKELLKFDVWNNWTDKNTTNNYLFSFEIINDGDTPTAIKISTSKPLNEQSKSTIDQLIHVGIENGWTSKNTKMSIVNQDGSWWRTIYSENLSHNYKRDQDTAINLFNKFTKPSLDNFFLKFNDVVKKLEKIIKNIKEQ